MAVTVNFSVSVTFYILPPLLCVIQYLENVTVNQDTQGVVTKFVVRIHLVSIALHHVCVRMVGIVIMLVELAHAHLGIMDHSVMKPVQMEHLDWIA